MGLTGKPLAVETPIDGNIIDDYMIGNARVIISDAAYIGKTQEDFNFVHRELMSAAWRIFDDTRAPR